MLHRPLLEYLPDFLRDLAEMSEIMESETTEIESVHAKIDTALANQFIATADEETLARMEKMFGVPIQPNATLDDRRYSIRATLNQASPFTICTLHKSLTDLCGADGYSCDLDAASYTITIQIALSRRNNYDAAEEMLRRILPCNLVLDLSLLYNQHSTLAHYTHAQLEEYTHYGLRNDEHLSEVI
jgi:hypothetical protein